MTAPNPNNAGFAYKGQLIQLAFDGSSAVLCGNKSASNVMKFYYNGLSVGTIATNTGTVPTNVFCLGARGTGAASVDKNTAGVLDLDLIGIALTDQNVADASADLLALRIALGRI